ncbi:hypothetical protein BSPWISOXPB_4644 [uncultured Gammaproteobacteria bacterium]|nr:hypothetical protein BSPWISOXPB_4644 [uncultured Gammaproteobacteria bacterium]
MTTNWKILSADPYIQAPYNTQSYNRYSYVMNNPLKYTDPDGYRSLALIAATITKAIVVNVTNIFVQMAIAYAVTYSVTYIETGSQSRPKRRTERCFIYGYRRTKRR